jgi:DNA repair photolyase
MNDPYMPLEREHSLIREALKIINHHKFPVHIITKSSLVLRDMDLLSEISKIYAAVSFTITTTNDKLAKNIEHGATLPSERLMAMRVLSDMRIYTGAILTPVLPFITDSSDNINTIVRAIASAGGKYILGWMGMTQREGQREYFYHQHDKYFPGIRRKYEKKFGESYNCPASDAAILYKCFIEACQLYKISTRMEMFSAKPVSTQLDLF